MKIYIAGTFTDQQRLRGIGTQVWELGHEITSTWLQEVKKPEMMDEPAFKRKLALKDLCEVARADLLILDNSQQSSGGKNAELGFSLAQFQHQLVWLVGEPTNVFQYLADRTFRTWDDCLTALKEKE